MSAQAYRPSRSSAASESSSVALWMVGCLLLGLLVGVLSLFYVFMWADAHDARADVKRLAASHQTAAMDPSMAEMGMSSASGSSGALTSFAGAAPANADRLAKAHTPYPAALPAARPGASVHLHARAD